MQKLFIISLLFFSALAVQGQTLLENWVPVIIEENRSVFINITGLSTFTGKELYVWSLQELSSPMTMEEVKSNIYKVRTYYHINREINRYSIVQIIFYDEKNNVLKQYSYEHNSDKLEFKFNYPILSNSDVEKILSKCKEYLNPSTENK